MVKKINFDKLVQFTNLLRAWQYLARGKFCTTSVQEFWPSLEQNLYKLERDLLSGAYQHGPYVHFVAADPKRRDIYVPTIRDRIVHQILAGIIEYT